MNRPEGQKCGNCKFFLVRNAAEGDLAKVAKNESECAPGEWVFRGERNVGCHGGPVKGLCDKWQERKASGPSVMSTQWCPMWSAGGPTLRGASGSMNKPQGEKPAPTSVATYIDRNAASLASLAVGVFAGVAYFFRRR